LDVGAEIAQLIAQRRRLHRALLTTTRAHNEPKTLVNQKKRFQEAIWIGSGRLLPVRSAARRRDDRCATRAARRDNINVDINKHIPNDVCATSIRRTTSSDLTATHGFGDARLELAERRCRCRRRCAAGRCAIMRKRYVLLETDVFHQRQNTIRAGVYVADVRRDVQSRRCATRRTTARDSWFFLMCMRECVACLLATVAAANAQQTADPTHWENATRN
jgi:hypothetical protein